MLSRLSALLVGQQSYLPCTCASAHIAYVLLHTLHIVLLHILHTCLYVDLHVSIMPAETVWCSIAWPAVDNVKCLAKCLVHM